MYVHEDATCDHHRPQHLLKMIASQHLKVYGLDASSISAATGVRVSSLNANSQRWSSIATRRLRLNMNDKLLPQWLCNKELFIYKLPPIVNLFAQRFSMLLRFYFAITPQKRASLLSMQTIIKIMNSIM